jgi:large subunit ribosomal protein L28
LERPCYRSCCAAPAERFACLGACCFLELLREDWTMAAVCDICGKHPGFGMSVSFSHKRNPRRWNPNIQRIKILEGRTPRRRNVCTSCIKANKVRRAI